MHPPSHVPLTLAAVLLLAGCTISMPVLGSHDAPATTGSVAAPIEVAEPLPRTLPYSDATKIGQAAAAVLWQADGAKGEWINAATGSSGSVEKDTAADATESCRPFQTIVTSIGGVHRYAGTLCRDETGSAVRLTL